MSPSSTRTGALTENRPNTPTTVNATVGHVSSTRASPHQCMSASTPPLARSLAESLDHTYHGHSMLITNETLRPVQGSKAPFSLWEEFSDKCKDTSFASKIQSAYPPKTIKYHDRDLKKPKQPHLSMYPSWTYDNYQYQAVGKCCALKGVILHIFNDVQCDLSSTGLSKPNAEPAGK